MSGNAEKWDASHDAASHTGGEAQACPACGAEARRTEARFCATCGRLLETREYLPADAIRSSYHQQRNAGPTPRRESRARSRTKAASRARLRVAAAVAPPVKNSNGASTTALAFVIYALVPYLGILFCPGALLMGGVGLLHARRAPHLGGRRASLMSVVFGLLILCAQLFLWWILYKVPEWAKQP